MADNSMGLRSVLLYGIEIILGIVLGLALEQSLGLLAFSIAPGLVGATFLLRRRRRKWQQNQPLMTTERPMSLRQFLGLLGLVALVAILFSPSTIQFGLNNGGSAPRAPSFQAVQPYLTNLESKYKVTVVNNDTALQQALNQPGKKAYFLIGPDENHNLTSSEGNLIMNQYRTGSLSLLLVEGNRTNNSFLQSLFNVTIRGDAIVDNGLPSYNYSWPSDEVFNVTARLDDKTVDGLIDVASPIIIGNASKMWIVASSSDNSNETSLSQNVTTDTRLGPRTVIAANQTSTGNRALLISDSSPFSNAYNRTWQTPVGINETAFAMTLTDWVTHSDLNTTIIVDNLHYTQSAAANTSGLSFGIGIPVGWIFALILEFFLKLSNSFYTGFLGAARPYLLGVALFTAWGFYGTLTKRYAKENRGKDDEPVPSIEKKIQAESKEKRDFLTTSRRKGFYVATLDQLYDVLGSLVEREFGTDIGSISLEQLTLRLGSGEAAKTKTLFDQLGRISKYARGEKRLLFPPILRWKSKTRDLTSQAEQILNQLGVTMTGKEQKKQLAYKLRRS